MVYWPWLESEVFSLLYQILKAGAVIQAWRWLRPRLIGLVVLILTILVVLVAHSEYLSYVARTEDTQYLLMSYLLKWGSLLLAILIYVIYAWVAKRNARARAANTSLPTEPLGDGFDFLRNKRKLDSYKDAE